MGRSLGVLGALLLTSSAWGQTAIPLEDLPPGPEAPTPVRAELRRWIPQLTQSFPGWERLSPPTVGQLRLAVVLAGFNDVDLPRFATPADLDALLLATAPADGRPPHGSMADYYLEASGGRLQLTGHVFPPVHLDMERADLAATALDPLTQYRVLNAALDAVEARDGRDAFDAFDAFVFVFAGEVPWVSREASPEARGSVLWPHSSLLLHHGSPWRYYVMHTGLQRPADIGVHCHELGHVLGIFDKYGVGDGVGLGPWCLMASGGHGARPGRVAVDAPTRRPEDVLEDLVGEQLDSWRERLIPGRACAVAGGPSRPLHPCAVCKHRLGWSEPRSFDPNLTARVSLGPIEDDPQQVLRVPLDPSGREAVYLAYRAQRGFDADLPRGGLLVWHVGSPGAMWRTLIPFEGVELVCAHGVESTDEALRDPNAVPFPYGDRDAVTVRGRRPGAWSVELSRITEVDGRCELEVRCP